MKTKETIYQTYTRTVCSICKNKNCNEELRAKIDGSLKCENFERCMKNKCKGCNKEKECFKEEKENESKSNK